jgi:predicted ATP-grasp superfamily ATP-dependent carboligase
MRVLVLDGHENQAVACTRSLRRAGHEVVVGADSSWSKAALSRAAAGRFRYTAPQVDAHAFVREVLAEAQRTHGTLVLPMTERTTLPVSAERERFTAIGARLVLPAHERVTQAFDKQHTTALAASLGIAVPHTRMLDGDRAEAEAEAAATRYPVVLKPRASEETSGTATRATGAPVYARTSGEFLDGWRELRARCSSVLVQEFIPGGGAGYFALCAHGAVRAEFAHRRIRDVRPTGSGSALRESAPVDPTIRAQARAILRALDWHGVAMVEFRVRPDGTPVFLEVNGRFWNSLPLAVFAGMDFPALVAQLAEAGDVRGPFPYRYGVRCRWLLGDLRHLVEVWRGAPRGYPGSFPARLTTLLQVLTPRRGTYHDNFTWHDPLPEMGDWVHFFCRRVPGHLARGKDAIHAARRTARS